MNRVTAYGADEPTRLSSRPRGLVGLLRPWEFVGDVWELHAEVGQRPEPGSLEALHRVLTDLRREGGVTEQGDLVLVDTLTVAVSMLFPAIAGTTALSEILDTIALRVSESWAP